MIYHIQLTDMAGKREVDPSSQEWALVDYRIQMITGKSSVQILHLYSHAPPQIPELRTEGVLQVTGLDPTYIERVARKSLPSQQMVFYCGHVNIHTLIKPNRVFCFLLCRLKLGKIGTVKDEVSLADSVLLESQGEKDAFQYNFMINDPQKYELEYEVHFSVGSEKEFVEGHFECMSCQNRKARIYCANEGLRLCEQCSQDHHNRRMMNNHTLQKIDKINTLPPCPKHQQPLTNYCSRCNKYLCGGCCQKGSTHGSNQHPVAAIDQLYLLKRQQTQSSSARQRQKLNSLLRNLQLKKEQIEENYANTKKQIEGILARSMATLGQMFSEKMFILSSDQIELKMMSERLEWAKTFIRFQEKNLKPIFYFQSQDKFTQQLGTVKTTDFPSIYTVQADLAATGNVVVGRKNQLEVPLRDPQTSRVGTGPGGSVGLTERSVRQDAGKTQRGIYDYDSGAEAPLRGELSMMLENTQLSFFCLR